ncbi:Scavenger mRNA decapping enzyme C-term binding [Musa troglodytarum]|uniref:Scavenger mRNA decapping enzyme C-term binding n=1 Tax=Musa troglodytarum TaxID=320322 RepID=A0A9E7G5Z4_9LILI|nr:Scavenger mRNA decapping enzyme C-term binding [Musa troglodytarum]
MAQRRLAVLSSHLTQTGPAPPSALGPLPGVSTSRCSGGGGETERSGEKGCVFCRIIRGESPAFKLYEDDVCICILDSSPLSLGHSLIIPKLHAPSLESTPPPVVAAMCSKIPILSSCIMKATQSDSFNLLVNNGLAAGQVIFHTHLHIIPRKTGDKLWPSESLRRQPIEANPEISHLVNSIQDLVSSLSNDSCLSDAWIAAKIRNHK